MLETKRGSTSVKSLFFKDGATSAAPEKECAMVDNCASNVNRGKCNRILFNDNRGEMMRIRFFAKITLALGKDG